MNEPETMRERDDRRRATFGESYEFMTNAECEEIEAEMEATGLSWDELCEHEPAEERS